MRPILYFSDEREFLNNGIGVLSDATSCLCTEVLNDQYELELKIPYNSTFGPEIDINRLIKAKPNYEDPPQPFRIYDVSCDLSGLLIVKAAHISYDTNGIPVAPFTTEDLDETIAYLNENRVETKESEFVMTCNFKAETAFELAEPASLRSLLAGSDNTIAKIYGGDYHFDGYKIELLEKRGTNRGICFRYRKNLTSFDRTISSEELYSGVYGYWKKNSTFVYGNIMKTGVDLAYDKILILNVTDKIDLGELSRPTTDMIDDFVDEYIITEKVGIPKYTMKLDYADDESIATICVGDTLGVVLPEYGIKDIARCNKVVFDCLRERNESIEIGDVDTGLAGELAEVL